MKSSVEQVAQFHLTFNHPIAEKPIIPDMDTVMFRINFIREELNELEAAAKAGDLIELADGLGDIQYVLDGFYLNAGLHQVKEKISTEIHRSNMSKACKTPEQVTATLEEMSKQNVAVTMERFGPYVVVKRESDGKVIKAVGYSKPDLKPIIDSIT